MKHEQTINEIIIIDMIRRASSHGQIMMGNFLLCLQREKMQREFDMIRKSEPCTRDDEPKRMPLY